MQITTQQEFDDIISDPTTDINTVIEFPGGTVDWVLNITRACTIFGNDTTIDVSGLGNEVAVNITAPIDMSGLTVFNSEKTAIRIDGVDGANFEEVFATGSNIGFEIIDTRNSVFDQCRSYENNEGVRITGSSNIIGNIESYQELGLFNISASDKSGLLPNRTYSFSINGEEYTFDTSTNLDFSHLVHDFNYSKRVSDNQLLKAEFLVTLTGGDIRFTALNYASVNLERSNTHEDVFAYINGFDIKESHTITCQADNNFSLQSKYIEFSDFYIWYDVANGGVDPAIAGKTSYVVDLQMNETAEQVAQKTYNIIHDLDRDEFDIFINIVDITINYNISGDMTDPITNTGFSVAIAPGALTGAFEASAPQTLEVDRDDRSHKNTFASCLIYENNIGVKLENSNHNLFDFCQVYLNKNIGVWHAPVSYANEFHGEIYQNIKYGVRNTDREHDFNISDTWFGDATGPSGAGRGEGDRISSGTTFEPWLQSGTEPELTYPVTRNWVWNMLGYPQTRVELTEDQITQCIEMALDRYHYYRTPEPYYWYAHIGHGQYEIELPPDINKTSIIEVIYQPNSDLFSQLSGSGESFFLTYYMQKSGGTFLSDFYVAMAYKETFERTLGIAPSYEFVTHPNADGEMRDFVRLYPRPSIGSVMVGLKISRTMSEMETDEKTWIRKYALAWAKQMLGRIRSKFGSMPGPTGEFQLNGSELIAEAQQEIEQLDRSVMMRGEPLGFSLG